MTYEKESELDISQQTETSELETQPTDKERESEQKEAKTADTNKERTGEKGNGKMDEKKSELDTFQPTDDKDTSALKHQPSDKEKKR